MGSADPSEEAPLCPDGCQIAVLALVLIFKLLEGNLVENNNLYIERQRVSKPLGGTVERGGCGFDKIRVGVPLPRQAMQSKLM